jgi:aminopeptidase N
MRDIGLLFSILVILCTLKRSLYLKQLKLITLDAVALEIDSVLVENVSQPFDYDRKQLIVRLLNPTQDKPIQVAIASHQLKNQKL